MVVAAYGGAGVRLATDPARSGGRQVEAARVPLAGADPLDPVAGDDDGSTGLLDDVRPDSEEDRGVGQRNHALAGAQRGEWILAEAAVQATRHEVSPRPHHEAMRRGP